MRDPRLGDDIDDFCVRCKRVMNHAVVSVINNTPAKVRCRTCHSDHDFRHEQAPPPKVDSRKAALFTEVLKKVNPGEAMAAAEAVDSEEPVELIEEPVEAMEAMDAEPPEAAEEAAEEAPAVEVPARKAKPLAKPQAKKKARR